MTDPRSRESPVGREQVHLPSTAIASAGDWAWWPHPGDGHQARPSPEPDLMNDTLSTALAAILAIAGTAYATINDIGIVQDVLIGIALGTLIT